MNEMLRGTWSSERKSPSSAWKEKQKDEYKTEEFYENLDKKKNLICTPHD